LKDETEPQAQVSPGRAARGLTEVQERGEMTRITRWGQTAAALTVGLYFLIVAFNNITDYRTNFEFVRHVLSMDSIGPDSPVTWRAINSAVLQHGGYVVIIIWETCAGLLCSAGGVRMLRRINSPEFRVAKQQAIAGLWAGIFLWSIAFITIGGEWFLMWESEKWNGELAALRMFTVNAVFLLFLCLFE
jgi:predicted small integral membrane protein